MEQFRLLIRFKNLGANDSISEHNNVIKEKNYVWGGWWAHTDEQLPIGQMAILESISRTEGVNIFLVDCESDKIYKAIISDVKFSHKGEKISSPEMKFTPKYYQTYTLLLWFKITSIEQVTEPDSFIKKYSYCDYSQFVTSNQYDYSAFNKKIISSVLTR